MSDREFTENDTHMAIKALKICLEFEDYSPSAHPTYLKLRFRMQDLYERLTPETDDQDIDLYRVDIETMRFAVLVCCEQPFTPPLSAEDTSDYILLKLKLDSMLSS